MGSVSTRKVIEKRTFYAFIYEHSGGVKRRDNLLPWAWHNWNHKDAENDKFCKHKENEDIQTRNLRFTINSTVKVDWHYKN